MVPRAVCACISGLFCLIPTSFCLCPQLFFLFFFLVCFQLFSDIHERWRKKRSLFSVFNARFVAFALSVSRTDTHTQPGAVQPSCLQQIQRSGSSLGRLFHLSSSIWCLLPHQLEFFHLCGFQGFVFVGFLCLPLFCQLEVLGGLTSQTSPFRCTRGVFWSKSTMF